MDTQDKPKIKEKHKVLGLLRAEGKTVAESAALIGYSEKHAYRVDKMLKSHGLTSSRKIKLASSAVNSLLSGESIGQAKPPDPETIRKTAEMVFDRAEPREVKGSPDTVNLAFILQQAHESMRQAIAPPPMLPPPLAPQPLKTPEEVEAERQAKLDKRYAKYQANQSRLIEEME